MTSRATCQDIIRYVHRLINDWTADTYDFDRVQSALDRYRVEHRYVELTKLETRTAGGAITYLTYVSPSYLETDAQIVDSDYAVTAPTTSDYTNGRFTYTAEPNYPLYLVGFEHDPYSAAADLLEQYATSEADQLQSFSGANGSFTYAGKARGIRDAANEYRKRSKRGMGGGGMSSVCLNRGDANGYNDQGQQPSQKQFTAYY